MIMRLATAHQSDTPHSKGNEEAGGNTMLDLCCTPPEVCWPLSSTSPGDRGVAGRPSGNVCLAGGRGCDRGGPSVRARLWLTPEMQ